MRSDKEEPDVVELALVIVMEAAEAETISDEEKVDVERLVGTTLEEALESSGRLRGAT